MKEFNKRKLYFAIRKGTKTEIAPGTKLAQKDYSKEKKRLNKTKRKLTKAQLCDLTKMSCKSFPISRHGRRRETKHLNKSLRGIEGRPGQTRDTVLLCLVTGRTH